MRGAKPISNKHLSQRLVASVSRTARRPRWAWRESPPAPEGFVGPPRKYCHSEGSAYPGLPENRGASGATEESPSPRAEPCPGHRPESSHCRQACRPARRFFGGRHTHGSVTAAGFGARGCAFPTKILRSAQRLLGASDGSGRRLPQNDSDLPSAYLRGPTSQRACAVATTSPAASRMAVSTVISRSSLLSSTGAVASAVRVPRAFLV